MEGGLIGQPPAEEGLVGDLLDDVEAVDGRDEARAQVTLDHQLVLGAGRCHLAIFGIGTPVGITPRE